MRPETLLLIIFSYAYIIAGAIVLSKILHKKYSFYFAGLVIGLFLWGIGDVMVLSASDPGVIDIGKFLFFIGPVIVPISTYFFLLSYPDDKPLPQRIYLPSIAAMLAMSIFIISSFESFVSDIVISDSGFNKVIPNNLGYLIYVIYFAAFFGLSYIPLIKNLKNKSGIRKTQVFYVVLGFSIFSLLSLTFNLYFPIIGILDLIWIGPILAFGSIGLAVFAMVSGQLFDIRGVVARSAAYVLSMIVIIAVFSVVVFFLTGALIDSSYSRTATQIISVGATVFLVLTHATLRKSFDRIFNKLINKDAYNSEALLDELNNIFVSAVDIRTLLVKSSHIINRTLHSKYCGIMVKSSDGKKLYTHGISTSLYGALADYTSNLKDKVTITARNPDSIELQHSFISKSKSAAVFKLIASNEEFGFLIIGERKSGNLFSKEDIKILEIISDDLALAVQNAMHFEEISSFNATLQDKIEEATAELRLSNKQLKNMDEIKDEFISMASHQLRTPLTSVKGYLSMVLEGDAGPVRKEQRRLLQQAFDSSQRMVFLISDLLNLSRLRTGKFIIEPTAISLPKIIIQEVERSNDSAVARGIKIDFKEPKNFPLFMLDETKIRQVIMNFLDNAIFYTPSGGHVSVELSELPRSVTLKIKDNGIGVPKSEQPRLFTKFYRAGNARRLRPDGTGIGLFMAKKVITGSGGTIIFSSEEGKGSTFGFSFPKQKIKTNQ